MFARCVRLPRSVATLRVPANLSRQTVQSPIRRSMAAGAAPATPYRALTYQYVPDILEKRGPYREGHLAAAQKLNDEGKCVIAGAFGDPVAGGLFIFKDMSDADIEAYVKADPYFQNGLITSWKIDPYMVAIGGK